MRAFPLLLALLAAPALGQDPGRGKLLYENHCGGCHYERVHQREAAKLRVKTLADLRDEVSQRAALVGRPFTLDDLDDIAEYLNRSHYKLTR